jgi:nicotinate-nucleotide pyrophosphorylase
MDTENTSIISSRGRKITPSLRALEYAEYLKGCPVRRARVKKCISAIPDTHMDFAEMDFKNTIDSNPVVDPVDCLEAILMRCGII